MKPIYNKTGLENLLELIRQDNPAAIVATQVALTIKRNKTLPAPMGCG